MTVFARIPVGSRFRRPLLTQINAYMSAPIEIVQKQVVSTWRMHSQERNPMMFNAIRGRLPIRLFQTIAVFVMGVAMASPSQAAGSVVNVSLWDKGAEMAMATDLGFPAAGKDMSKVTMGIAVSQDTVKAGEITFEVLNSSKDAIHEMIITRLRDLTIRFPYISDESRVNEDKMPDILGEVSEIDPGKSAAVRLDLTPGKYLLFCNIPGHFAAGMWTIFTVK